MGRGNGSSLHVSQEAKTVLNNLLNLYYIKIMDNKKKRIGIGPVAINGEVVHTTFQLQFGMSYPKESPDHRLYDGNKAKVVSMGSNRKPTMPG